MDSILLELDKLTKKCKNRDNEDNLKKLTKCQYDFTKLQEVTRKEGRKALPQLIINEFDVEQIWQQIEIQNSEKNNIIKCDVENSVSNTNNLKFLIEIENTPPENNLNHISAPSNVQTDEEISHSCVNVEKENPKKSYSNIVNSNRTTVDDNFFKVHEMEKFLLREERKTDTKHKRDSDEESIDMFENVDDGDSTDEEHVTQFMYKDFFGGDELEVEQDSILDNEMSECKNSDNEIPNDGKSLEKSKKKGKVVTFADLSSHDDSDAESSKINENNDQKKSDFEIRQQRLSQMIERLEGKSLKEAPWQMKGEIDSTKRPQNSLLEEVLDFDLLSRSAPLITEQTTMTLEEIIKRRIKDKAWDDVIRKEKPVDDQLLFRKPQVLDHSKSQLSLAQVYEAEYLKQKQASSGEQEPDNEPESHKEIRESMKSLFSKLDALCHYHYTPRAPQAEVKIVSNTPAITVEEVAPIATSEATLLAPEEIKKKNKGELMSKDERTQTDKKRERRKKKKLQQRVSMNKEKTSSVHPTMHH